MYNNNNNNNQKIIGRKRERNIGRRDIDLIGFC